MDTVETTQQASIRPINPDRGRLIYKLFKFRGFDISISGRASEKRGLFRKKTTKKEIVIKKTLTKLWQSTD